MRIRREAAWGYGLSALIHLSVGAALLSSAPRPAPVPAPAPGPTRVRLVSSPGAPDPAPAGPSRAHRPEPAVARPRMPAPAVATSAISGPAGPPEPEAPSPGRGGAAVAQGGGGPASVSAPGLATAMGRAAAGGDPATLELSRRLALAAQSCYPPAARRLRAQGEVVVEFCLDERGASRSIRVDRPSGSALLDRAAAECVVPRALPAEGARGCFTLPVRFGG